MVTFCRLIRFFESGLVKRWRKQINIIPVKIFDKDNSLNAVEFEQLYQILLIPFAGIVFSSVVFVLEIFYKNWEVKSVMTYVWRKFRIILKSLYRGCCYVGIELYQGFQEIYLALRRLYVFGFNNLKVLCNCRKRFISEN